jgi:putative addiction module killer protein
LRDRRAYTRIIQRIERLADGHFGDVRSVGGGVSDMRVDHGPGYRLYFVRRGLEVVILLCGGDKSTQSRDISTAHRMAKDIDDE